MHRFRQIATTFIDMSSDPLTLSLQQWPILHRLWNLAQVQSTTNTQAGGHARRHAAFNHSHLLILLLPWPQLVKVHDSMFLWAPHDPYMELRAQIECYTLNICYFQRPALEHISQFALWESIFSAVCGQASEGSGFASQSGRWESIHQPRWNWWLDLPKYCGILEKTDVINVAFKQSSPKREKS